MKILRRKRLTDLLKSPRFNGDRAAFLASSGLSKGRLTQLLNPNEPFGDTAARNLCEALSLPAGWFDAAAEAPPDYKKNQPSALTDKALVAINSIVTVPAVLSIPLLSWVRAGDFCEAPGQFSRSDAEELMPRPLFNTSTGTFALLVRGDSMDVPGGYREGEIVYIDPDVSPTPGRDVLAKTETGMTLKRYKEDEDGPYLLQLNGNKIIRPSTWHVCGVVVFSGQKR